MEMAKQSAVKLHRRRRLHAVNPPRVVQVIAPERASVSASREGHKVELVRMNEVATVRIKLVSRRPHCVIGHSNCLAGGKLSSLLRGNGHENRTTGTLCNRSHIGSGEFGCRQHQLKTQLLPNGSRSIAG